MSRPILTTNPKGEAMNDDINNEISELFEAAIDSFPAELQEAAREWMALREAAFKLIQDIQDKGLEALL